MRTERVNVCKLLRTEPNTEQVCRGRAPVPGQQGFWPENSGSEGGDHTGLSSNGVFLDDRSVFYSDGATLGGLDGAGHQKDRGMMRSSHDCNFQPHSLSFGGGGWKMKSRQIMPLG